MLSSKPDKNETKFAARLDVLAQRIDTLASTVATTASSLAKKDGELAALRKELDARDERLAAVAAQGREPIASNELRELKQAVATLAAERSTTGGSSARSLDDLTAKVALLGQRLETLSTTVSTTAAGLAGRDGELAAIRRRLDGLPALAAGADPQLSGRITNLAGDVTGTKLQLDTLSQEVAGLKALAERPTDATLSSEEIRETLAALRAKVEELGALRAGVTEEQLEERVTRTDATLTRLAGRVDLLASTVDSAVAGIAEKENELAALHRHVTESSSRIESVVEDIRDALSAFPELGSANLDDLVVRLDHLGERLERSEETARKGSETGERLAAELARRIEEIESRVASVASEVARAKTLWPVALRSLEARLDDVATHARPPEPAVPDDHPASAGSGSADDDLLAGLRDSLHAMETVAAEMARASDALAAPGELPSQSPPAHPHEAVAAGGATVVPLRSSDP